MIRRNQQELQTQPEVQQDPQQQQDLQTQEERDQYTWTYIPGQGHQICSLGSQPNPEEQLAIRMGRSGTLRELLEGKAFSCEWMQLQAQQAPQEQQVLQSDQEQGWLRQHQNPHQQQDVQTQEEEKREAEEIKKREERREKEKNQGDR